MPGKMNRTVLIIAAQQGSNFSLGIAFQTWKTLSHPLPAADAHRQLWGRGARGQGGQEGLLGWGGFLSVVCPSEDEDEFLSTIFLFSLFKSYQWNSTAKISQGRLLSAVLAALCSLCAP